MAFAITSRRCAAAALAFVGARDNLPEVRSRNVEHDPFRKYATNPECDDQSNEVAPKDRTQGAATNGIGTETITIASKVCHCP
jgi:hypothetical protein